MKKIEIDKNKEIDYSKLLDFGFLKDNNVYIYKKNILDNDFTLIIEINNNSVISKLIDNSFGDEYLMADVDNTSGEYIGKVKESYENMINDFLDKCTIYKLKYHNQVNEVINYIVDKYDDNIEYLWKSTPDSGIFRNKKNKKWYAAILSVKENRVGGNTEDIIMVIDLMYKKNETFEIVDNKKIYPGYHMNKNSWITLKLDGSLDNEFIYKYIDISYDLSIRK